MSAIQKRLQNMEIRFDESEVIVVDVGTGYIKAGYSGEDLPRVVLPTIIGMHESSSVDDATTNAGDSKPNKVVSKKMGNEAYLHQSDHELYNPIQRGIVTDWEKLTDLLEHVFYTELGIEPRNATVLMTDSPMSRKSDKQQLASIMFDHFRFKAFALQNTAALSLFSNGTTTGLVAESGEGVTYTVPVFEGYALPHALQTIEVAGQDITKQLIKELQTDTQVDMSHYHLIRDIKEKMCHVARTNYAAEMERRDDELSIEDRSYELPGGEIIEVNQRKRITASECMFNPSIVGVSHPEFDTCDGGIVQLAYRSIEKCDSDLKVNLYNNIVLAGGTTLLKNFP